MEANVKIFEIISKPSKFQSFQNEIIFTLNFQTFQNFKIQNEVKKKRLKLVVESGALEDLAELAEEADDGASRSAGGWLRRVLRRDAMVHSSVRPRVAICVSLTRISVVSGPIWTLDSSNDEARSVALENTLDRPKKPESRLNQSPTTTEF